MTEENGSDRVLDALFEVAQSACAAGSSTEEFEAPFVRLLEYIKANPACVRFAEQRFLDGLSRRPLCHELIGFCMHSLRLEAVRREAERLIVPEDPRRWGPFSNIVASFEDDWEDAEMYDYYGGPRGSRRRGPDPG